MLVKLKILRLFPTVRDHARLLLVGYEALFDSLPVNPVCKQTGLPQERDVKYPDERVVFRALCT